MELNQKFDIKEENGKMILTTVITKEYNIGEALKEKQSLDSEIINLKSQEAKIKQEIEHKVLEENLEKTTKTKEMLMKLAEEWNPIIEPRMAEMKINIKKKVRTAKVASGYARLKDQNEKIVKQNQILGPICVDFDLDVNCKLIREIKNEFDKI